MLEVYRTFMNQKLVNFIRDKTVIFNQEILWQAYWLLSEERLENTGYTLLNERKKKTGKLFVKHIHLMVCVG